jgi:hypothetical protein
MAYRQQLRTYVTIGAKIMVTFQGKTLEGEVVNFETQAPQDASITIENDKGNRIIVPITPNNLPIIEIDKSSIVFSKKGIDENPNKKKNKLEDEELTEDELLEDNKKNKNDDLPNYDLFDDKQLITAAKKRGIKITKNGKSLKRSELKKLLKQYDADK